MGDNLRSHKWLLFGVRVLYKYLGLFISFNYFYFFIFSLYKCSTAMRDDQYVLKAFLHCHLDLACNDPDNCLPNAEPNFNISAAG